MKINEQRLKQMIYESIVKVLNENNFKTPFKNCKKLHTIHTKSLNNERREKYEVYA